MAKKDGLTKIIEAAGFESFDELEQLSGMNERTWYNWFKKYPVKFDCMLKGAIQQKNPEINSLDLPAILTKICDELGEYSDISFSYIEGKFRAIVRFAVDETQSFIVIGPLDSFNLEHFNAEISWSISLAKNLQATKKDYHFRH